jgi:tRNA-2-methylthio-N6-dimethylallyladenosine synthase
MPYLHLPVQSGSDNILHRMNRKHGRDDYFRIIDRLRDASPDIALSGDFIVGFPGETDKDFADTISLIDKVGYTSAYSFKYSKRPGTPAASDETQVDEQVKTDRLAALQQLISSQQLAFNKSCEGRVMPVLIERDGGREGQMTGRSPYMQSVYLDGNSSMIGQIVNMKIEQGRQNSVLASVVSDGSVL